MSQITVKHHQPYSHVQPYVTKDGSVIRELMHPNLHGNQQQSLAEARIPANQRTLLHRHHQTEELYYIFLGHGLMRLGEQEFRVKVGDTICIPPGTAHCITALGDTELVILCACSPAYTHTDTELLEDEA